MSSIPLISSERLPLTKPADLEKGFSSKEHFSTAFKTGALALMFSTLCPPLSMGLGVVSAWNLLSGAIVEVNKKVEGGYLEHPIHELHGLTTDVNSYLKLPSLFPRTLSDSFHKPQGNLEGRPILLVNGYLSFGSTWDYLRQNLVKKGLGPVYTMNVGTGKSITTYAEQVAEKVKQIQAETHREDVILIGHSKGGLVSSYYATQLADPTKTKVTDVITIGSPLAGTPLGYIGPGYDAYEMRTDSEFNRNLRQKMQEHPEIRFFHIASEADHVASPSSALQGSDPTHQMVLKDLGHLALVFSSRVSDQIGAWLTKSDIP